MVELDFDLAKLTKDGDALVRRYLTASTKVVGETTRALEKKLEAATQAAVPGRLSKAWASRSDPKSGPARDPVGRVFVNGQARSTGAITYWSQPGSASRAGGKFFAVPLPAAGKPARVAGQDYQLTPSMWEAAHPGIKLRPVFRTGRVPLLVADGVRLSGKRQLAKGSKTKQFGPAARGTATVPIFALLPTVKFRNAFAVEPLVKASEAELVKAYVREVAGMR